MEKKEKIFHNYEDTHPLKSFTLITNIMGYGPCPEDNEIVQQRLTVNSRCRFYLTNYNWRREKLTPILRGVVPPNMLGGLMRNMEEYFEEEWEPCWWCDCGSWEIRLRFRDGKVKTFTGPTGCEEHSLQGIVQKLITGVLQGIPVFGFNCGDMPVTAEEFMEQYEVKINSFHYKRLEDMLCGSHHRKQTNT